MNEKKMPVYGVGPIYGILTAIITLIFVVLAGVGVLSTGALTKTWQVATFATIGTLLMVLGLVLWLPCAIGKHSIDKYVNKNELYTGGAYKYVRNPIYSGIMFLCSGLLVAFHNVWLLILPPIFYFVLTMLMILTEEEWLTKQFGEEYISYCNKVHRLIPWPPKKDKNK